MSLHQIGQDEHYLRRNNGVIRWLARILPAEVKVVVRDRNTDTEVLELEYDGWRIDLDYLNTEGSDFWWSGTKGADRVGSRCRNTTHLLNSIKKHCKP